MWQLPGTLMEAPDHDGAKVGCILLASLCLFAWLLIFKLMGWI